MFIFKPVEIDGLRIFEESFNSIVTIINHPYNETKIALWGHKMRLKS